MKKKRIQRDTNVSRNAFEKTQICMLSKDRTLHKRNSHFSQNHNK